MRSGDLRRIGAAVEFGAGRRVVGKQGGRRSAEQVLMHTHGHIFSHDTLHAQASATYREPRGPAAWCAARHAQKRRSDRRAQGRGYAARNGAWRGGFPPPGHDSVARCSLRASGVP